MMKFIETGVAGHKCLGYMSQDIFHCTECNQDYWFSPAVQRCLRKNTKCPNCNREPDTIIDKVSWIFIELYVNTHNYIAKHIRRIRKFLKALK